MSANLLINPDGANFQAQAVLAYLRYVLGDGIESSWNSETKRYDSDIRFTRYDNCREQGYVVYMRNRSFQKQINLAFYEHRNSDSICVVVSNTTTFNAPLLNDITGAMKDKYDTSFESSYGEPLEAAKFIAEKLTEFWDENAIPVPPVAKIGNRSIVENILGVA